MPYCAAARAPKLFLKGEKCYLVQVRAARTAPTPPGQHGQARQQVRRASTASSSVTKQKARRAYGLMEGQFKRTFARATGMKGITGDNLLQPPRACAWIMSSTAAALPPAALRPASCVCHGLMTVNGKKVDIPSYTVKQGDVIGVKSTKKDIAIFKAAKEGSGRVVPKWLTTDLENLTATVAALPQRDDVDLTLQENMIVEFYSR